MKLLQFTYPEAPKVLRVGLLRGDGVLDLNKADKTLGSTLLEILKKDQVNYIKRINLESQQSIPLNTINIKAPITGMDKVLGIGLNYKDQLDQLKAPVPETPLVFSKFASTVIGHSDALKLRTDVTQKVDLEVELAVVIGKAVTNVKAKDAYDCILGYTVSQDITDKEWLHKNGGQLTLAKCMDTFTPLGPWIVTADEIKDPHTLDIECSLNGALKQKGNTNQMVQTIPAIIERLTSVMTLFPGDVILTGTPSLYGGLVDPPVYLKQGDTILSKIQGIGEFKTDVVNFK